MPITTTTCEDYVREGAVDLNNDELACEFIAKTDRLVQTGGTPSGVAGGLTVAGFALAFGVWALWRARRARA